MESITYIVIENDESCRYITFTCGYGITWTGRRRRQKKIKIMFLMRKNILAQVAQGTPPGGGTVSECTSWNKNVFNIFPWN